MTHSNDYENSYYESLAAPSVVPTVLGSEFTRGPSYDEQRPTWTITMGGSIQALDLAAALGDEQGANLSTSLGVWEGDVESSFTITIQATHGAVDTLLDWLAHYLPDERFAHVTRQTRGGFEVRYIALAEYRDGWL